MKRCLLLRFLILAMVVITACAQKKAEELPPMMFVEGGGFKMGGGVREEENPTHDVRLNSFFIAPYETTVGEWKEFLKASGMKFNWDGDAAIGSPKKMLPTDRHPIMYLTWFEALSFCNWMSRKHGLKEVYQIKGELQFGKQYPPIGVKEPDVIWDRSANGFRLPTEAEWEYAARGGKKSQGFRYAGSDNLDEVGWYDKEGRLSQDFMEVGKKKSNELGIYDMSGNVSEWCWDFFDLRYYKRSPVENPAGPTVGYDPDPNLPGTDLYRRSVRGGASISPIDMSEVTARMRTESYERVYSGFRVVRNAN